MLTKLRRLRNFFNNDGNVSMLSALKLCEIYAFRRFAWTHCYNMPTVVQIEITNFCNSKCKWCTRNSPEMKQLGFGSMDLKDFKNIVSQLKGVKILHVFGVGEPLLYRDLIEAINYSAQFVPFINVTTNAILLNKTMSQKLAESSLSKLTVSIDATDKQIFEYVRGINFEKVIRNVKYFKSISDIPIAINSVICKQNLESLKKMPYLAKELGAEEIVFLPLKEFEDSVKDNFGGHLTGDEIRNFVTVVSKDSGRLGIRTNVQDLPGRFKEDDCICTAPFYGAFINYLGYMTPCCSWTTLNIINVMESRFRAGWNSSQMRNFRKMILYKNYPPHCRSVCNKKLSVSNHSINSDLGINV
jgi:MoaA/NifB/PqqE/SkfB family radical SAM enzyme